MTRCEVKAMFQPGQRWHAVRNGGTIHRDEIREVVRVGSKDIVFRTHDGRDYYTGIPKAREVVEARPGFLRFVYEEPAGVEVTLNLL